MIRFALQAGLEYEILVFSPSENIEGGAYLRVMQGWKELDERKWFSSVSIL